MSKTLTNVRLFGILGDKVGHEWNLKVKSLGQALNFIEMNTKKLYKTLHDFDKKNIRYQVVINGRKFKSDKELTIENLDDIKNSELAMKYENLKTIDIVPVLEGADSDILQVILGVILIIVGVVVGLATGVGFAIAVAGVTLLASGVVGLLTKPPKFEDFREIEQGGKTSYLFAGPQNIIGEGGPVPVGYGRLIVGSQVISAAYVIRDFDTTDTSSYLRDEYGNLKAVNKLLQ